jgi:hypothetical protein
VFFLATAPTSTNHHVNVSPRAPGNSVVVLDTHTVAIADLSGSGSETAAHILQNSRITIMFVNLLEGPPMILRLFGMAQILLPAEADQAVPSLLQRFPPALTADNGFRAVYLVTCHRITASCGYSMPVMAVESFRTELRDFTELKGRQGMQAYREHKNSYSIDGLPSLAMLQCGDVAVCPCREKGYIFGKRAADGAERADEATAARAAAQSARTSAARTLANVGARGCAIGMVGKVGRNEADCSSSGWNARWAFVAGAVAFGLLQLVWLRAVPVVRQLGFKHR